MLKPVMIAILITLGACSSMSMDSDSGSGSSTPPSAISKSQAENILQSDGYSNPDLSPSQKYPGGWMGTAIRGGTQTEVTVDAAGNVIAP